MRHLLLTSLLLCLAFCDVTSQFPGIFRSSPIRPFMGQPGSEPRCMLSCQRGYVPGTCLCQPEARFFPFLFPATPCKFAVCPKGKVCQMEKGRAECVVIANDRPSVVVCNLPSDPGPCEALMPRYFFDTTDGTCKTFNYGGCQGNKNRFLTKADCEDTCIANVPAVDTGHSLTQGISAVNAPSGAVTKQNEVCLLPQKVGLCLAYIPSFFYNSTSQQCQEFVYGGCGGNQNRFPSLQACQTTCQGAQPDHTAGPVLSPVSDCNLPKEVGLCRAAMPAFYYNTNSGQCESFIYGGCGGNANNFDSRSQCQQKCQPQKESISGSQSPKPACLLPKQVGLCRARMPRWFFDQQSQSCKPFFYGGCGGNGNRFPSQADCQHHCSQSTNSGVPSSNSDCNLPKVTGPCRAYVPSYFYNTDTGRCEFFGYGGCRGNANRFGSRRQCRQKCE